MPGTTPYLIRRASEHDAARIAEIQVKTWQEAYQGLMPAEYLDSLDPVRRSVVWKDIVASPEETVLVALRGSNIIGFCDLLPSRDIPSPSEIAEIASIYVEPSSWGLGAGRCLMKSVLDHAKDHGFTIVTLWVLSSNDRARSFYKKAGFAPDGAEKTKERPGFTLHELRYRRDL